MLCHLSMCSYVARFDTKGYRILQAGRILVAGKSVFTTWSLLWARGQPHSRAKRLALGQLISSPINITDARGIEFSKSHLKGSYWFFPLLTLGRASSLFQAVSLLNRLLIMLLLLMSAWTYPLGRYLWGWVGSIAMWKSTGLVFMATFWGQTVSSVGNLSPKQFKHPKCRNTMMSSLENPLQYQCINSWYVGFFFFFYHSPAVESGLWSAALRQHITDAELHGVELNQRKCSTGILSGTRRWVKTGTEALAWARLCSKTTQFQTWLVLLMG